MCARFESGGSSVVTRGLGENYADNINTTSME